MRKFLCPNYDLTLLMTFNNIDSPNFEKRLTAEIESNQAKEDPEPENFLKNL